MRRRGTLVVRSAREPVAVVGAGVKAPGGLAVADLWTSVCAARSTAEPYTDARFPPDARVLVSRVVGFDPAAYLSPVERRRFDRAHQLAIGAAQDALDALWPRAAATRSLCRRLRRGARIRGGA